jgi:alpha-L-fucosidase
MLASGASVFSVSGFCRGGGLKHAKTDDPRPADKDAGCQRLSLKALKEWQNLEYGMFIHFGMSTFTGNELDDGRSPASAYRPSALDVGQWISVARDAGMRYAVLTAKHVAGHCLWPTKCTPYNVSNSGDRTDVVGRFVRECGDKGVLPGLYYCSWDNHNRFGSKTPSDAGPEGAWSDMNRFPQDPTGDLPFYTTSLYQNFQTAQITELLSWYGRIMEAWIDIPGLLGRGYRTFLYRHVSELQPDAVVMMNCCMEPAYAPDYAFPADIRAFERNLPSGYDGWETVNGKRVYLPGEFCQPIGKEWFHVEGDLPRSLDDLEKEFRFCRRNRINYLLDVPPDRRGLVPDACVRTLEGLRRRMGI